MKKLFFCVALFFAVSLVNAQSLKSLDKFKASFEMDSAESLGGGERNSLLQEKQDLTEEFFATSTLPISSIIKMDWVSLRAWHGAKLEM